MECTMLGTLTVDPAGPLATTAVGGEDLRGLVLAVAETLWPEGAGTWFPHGGFALDDDQCGDRRVMLRVEATYPPGEDTLPMASLCMVLEIALARAADVDLHEARIRTRIPGNPRYIADEWAASLLRGAPPGHCAEITIRAVRDAFSDEAAATIHGEATQTMLREQLYSPDYEVAVASSATDGETLSAHIEPVHADLLGLGVLIDTVRRALRGGRVDGAVEIHVVYRLLGGS